jgi:hypothetical protein
MKILFISEGRNVDYLCDCLFHGLCSLEGVVTYTANEYWYMFEGNDEPKLREMYGLGFSVANRIPANRKNPQNQQEIEQSIRSHYYDAIVYGSVFRCQDYLPLVLQHYRREEIIFVDGEDSTLNLTMMKRLDGTVLLPKLFLRDRKAAMHFAGKGIYFKRELLEKDRRVFLPIAFAIPAGNIVGSIPDKTRDMAFIYPGDKKTYIYKTEKDYYQGYREARFATTFKKAGWDCMRHYEILANGCIPYFPDIARCPDTTMVNFPKGMIKETNRLYESKKFNDATYEYYCGFLLSYTKEILTTEKLAQYVLSFIS